MKTAAVSFVITMAIAPAILGQSEPDTKPAASQPVNVIPTAGKAMTDLAWLVGGVWTADASQMGGGMQRIETRYRWSDNGSFIRFTTHFVTDKMELKTYDGNFFWNAPQKTFAMWYMDSRSAITESAVKLDGDHTEMLFQGTDFEGKQADLRVEVIRRNNDLYRWELAEKQGGNWKPLAALDYARKPGS